MLMLPRLSALDESLSVGVYLCTARRTCARASTRWRPW